MRARRDRLDVLEVPDEGHAPLLAGANSIGPIVAFVAACDGAGPHRPIAHADQDMTQGTGSTEKLAGASPR